VAFETLKILIDADAKGALREMDKLAASSERAAAKAESKWGKFSSNLTSYGTKAAIGGAIVVAGLYKLAEASDVAEKADLKLTNSIKNSDQVFAQNGKALRDLAKSLSEKTASDKNAIKSGEAVLVSFKLTSSQVAQLTPLVNDLSRKYGIDLVAAAKAVGKAVDGNGGALKRFGVSLDTSKLKADGFGTTVEGLRKSVGGFAVEEGRTFSGQLAILGNNFRQLEESVGKGAAGVFSDLAGGLSGAINGLNNVNPALGESVGRIGAVGAVGVTAVGGLAALVGQFSKLKSAALNAEGGLTNFGKAAAGLGVIGLAVGIFEVVQAIDDAKVKSEDFQIAIKRVAEAKGPEQVTQSFKQLYDVTDTGPDKFGRFIDSLDVFNEFHISDDKTVSIDGLNFSVDRVGKTIDKAAQSGNMTALATSIQLLKEKAKGSPEAIDALNAKINDGEKILKNYTGLSAQATIAQRKQEQAVKDSVDAYDKQNVTIQGAKTGLDQYAKGLKFLVDQQNEAETAAKAFGEAIARSNPQSDLAEAAVATSGALRTLGGDLADLPKNFTDIFDPTKITDKSGEAIKKLDEFGKDARNQIQAAIASGASDADVTKLADSLRASFVAALQAAGVPPDQIPQYVGLANLDPIKIKAAIDFGDQQSQLQILQQEIDFYGEKLRNDPNVLVAFQAFLQNPSPESLKAVHDAIQHWSDDPKNHPKLKIDVEPGTVWPGFFPTPTGVTPGVQGGKASTPKSPKPAPTPAPAAPAPSLFGSAGGAPSPVYGGTGGLPAPPKKKRALGGPMTAGDRSYVNERGAEMWVPSTSGFVMTANDSKRLVAGVEQMVANGGGHTFNITSTDPVLTATEVVRKQRDAAFLIGS
jgi:hypothetical protein